MGFVMLKLVILGTATNIPDETHENTHMALVSDERFVLIDGPGNPYSGLLRANLDPARLTDILVTHFHPDHVSGIPLLLMALGLTGRKTPMTIYANQHCTVRLQRMLEDFDWEKWHDFPVNFHLLPEEELHLAIESTSFRLLTSPVKHFIPAVGLRIEPLTDGRVLAYSGDTSPVSSFDRLAEGCEIMVHEAAGESEGHSSAVQAGEAATRAGAKTLVLVHYPVGDADQSALVLKAEKVFSGDIVVAEDFITIPLG